MKYFLGFLFLIVLGNDLTKIAATNKLKKAAEEYFEQGNFELAAKNYKILIDSFDIDDDAIRLNLAHALYELKDTTAAVDQYKAVAAGSERPLKSQAYNQLGVIAGSKNMNQQALDFFKQSLRENPGNEDARYNYELTKKKLKDQPENQEQNQDQNNQEQEQQNEDKEDKQDSQKEQENKEQNEQNQDQENKEQNKKEEQQQNANQQQSKEEQQSSSEDKEQKKGERKQNQEEQNKEQAEERQSEENKPEEGEEQPQAQPITQSIEEKLEEMNLTPEKARMILEAMKNSEIQYIQQNKRKPTKQRDSNKPDW